MARQSRGGLTHLEVLEFPVSVPLTLSNKALGLSRSYGYELAKRGEYPVAVRKFGSRYFVTRAALLRLLDLDSGDS